MKGKWGKSKRATHGPNGRKRANHTGTLERRGEKWLARWFVETAQGSSVRKSRTLAAATLEEARRELAALTEGNALMSREKVIRKSLDELDAIRGELRRVEDAQPVLMVADAWAAFERSASRRRCSPRTLAGYEGYWRRLDGWIEANRSQVVEMRQVTADVAEDYADELRQTRDPGTFNKHLTFLRMMWRIIMGDEPKKRGDATEPHRRRAKIAQNPWLAIEKLPEEVHTRRELTVDELARVLTPLTGEMRLLFALGIYTGLRLGDCALLEWGAVDVARGRMSLIPRKTKRHAHGKPTVIPIHATLAAMLNETPPGSRTGYLMPRTAETYQRDKGATLSHMIQDCFMASGIRTQTRREGRKALTDVGFHSLRHTFVSLSANAGTPLAIVQAIVGHSSPAMTRHYFHESEAALKSAVAALPDLMDAPQIAADAEKSPLERREAAGHIVAPTDVENAPRSIMERFRAMLDEMTDEERREASLMIAGYWKRTPEAPTTNAPNVR